MNKEILTKVLISPFISEKSTMLTNLCNQYNFKVRQDANKTQIKAAVEALFNVKVANVRVTTVRAKAKRFGQIEGKKKGWKKAYVRLQEGSKIELIGAQA